MILEHFRGTPRPAQTELLTQLEAQWDDHSVFVVPGATGIGKSLVADCVATWAWRERKLTTALGVPNNVLLDQYRRQFPRRTTLSGMGTYRCDDFDQTCKDTLDQAGRHCKGCPYRAAKAAVPKAATVVTNYHAYWSHDIEKQVLILDEAHAVIPFVATMMGRSLWWHRYKFPLTLETKADVLGWVESQMAKAPDQHLREVRDLLLAPTPDMIVRVEAGHYHGKESPVIRLVPVSVHRRAVTMWPPAVVHKVILMSATINDIDLAEMNLLSRRIVKLKTKSPIPPGNRPVIYDPCYSVTYESLAATLPLIADRINYRLAQHPVERGVVHVPYAIATMLRPLLTSPRLVWHTPLDKRAVYADFVSTPTDSRVLVASGFYEGLDLPGDLGRWQSIVKIPFLSLADSAVAYRARREPDWYLWQAIKLVVQAAGRVCRGETDYGVTYIEDRQFEALWRRGRLLFPIDFVDALGAMP